MTARWFGDRAVLIEAVDAGERQRLMVHLRGRHAGWEVRSGMNEVLVEVLEPHRALLADVARAVAEMPPSALPGDADVDEVVIEVTYDGEDLAEVATRLAVTVEEVADAHAAQSWRVAMMGFAPGFAYLEPAGPALLDWSCLARRSSPRPRVPRGSVAVAAGMSAVYPASMPGGWHLVGTTRQPMFDPDNLRRPARLAAGDRVRFVRGGSA